MANYLAEHGWKTGGPWGREVVVGAKAAETQVAEVPLRTQGCRAVRDMSEPRPMREWQKLRRPPAEEEGAAGSSAPDASLVRVGHRAFLVHHNYEVLLTYNCAHHYALGVSLLSERLR